MVLFDGWALNRGNGEGSLSGTDAIATEANVAGIDMPLVKPVVGVVVTARISLADARRLREFMSHANALSIPVVAVEN